MKKKYIKLSIVFIIILAIIIFGLNKSENKNDETSSKEVNQSTNVKPISKETALKVIKAEYGDKVINTEEDIKQEGDEYIVDVHVRIEENEGEVEDMHVHEQSIGKHKINIYTGEIERKK
ncbi:hypothetical protein [Paraclostridium bifermentans]|uniref:hypothetical protein n=1 Tax=Paraclostridium bifermentans TaxID=1490 RepID=UPI00359C1B94